MTLRLALLLVSLVLIGIIGLLCHQKYKRSNSKKRPNELASEIDSGTDLEQELNTPFFTEGIVSDISQADESVLEAPQTSVEPESESHELTTSLEELMDKKKIDQQLAQQLLPDYSEDELITEYIAVLPNVKQTQKQINKVTNLLQQEVSREVELLAMPKGGDAFVEFDSVNQKDKVEHLKTVLHLKDSKGVVDEKVLAGYQQFVQKMATQFAREYRFALTDDQAAHACHKINQVVKEHDLIIILYILAQPDDSFSGEALVQAAAAVGLEHGEFDFFNLHSATETNLGAKVYSLANMYKPGTFDLDTMDKFSTMGLCAFMVPALLEDPVSGFREMCTSCKHIADQLGGVLTTNQRELLSEENYIAICSQISKHKDDLNAAGIDNGSDLAAKLFA